MDTSITFSFHNENIEVNGEILNSDIVVMVAFLASIYTRQHDDFRTLADFQKAAIYGITNYDTAGGVESKRIGLDEVHEKENKNENHD